MLTDSMIATLKTKTVMAVDDDEMILKLVGVVVNNLGAKFITAHSGEACLELLKSVDPDMLVLDVQMSGINGLDLLARVRAEFPKFDGRVLFLTGHKDEDLIERAEELRCDGFALKPIDPYRLRERIKSTFFPSYVEKE